MYLGSGQLLRAIDGLTIVFGIYCVLPNDRCASSVSASQWISKHRWSGVFMWAFIAVVEILFYQQRFHWKTQRRSAYYCRVSPLRDGDLPLRIRLPGERHLLVHSRRRLDHRAHLCRVCATRQRCYVCACKCRSCSRAYPKIHSGALNIL